MQHPTYPNWQLQPFRLTNKEIQDPMSVLNRFFHSYNLPKCREILWELQVIAFGGNTADIGNGEEVVDFVFFHRHLEELLEAAQIICQQQKDKTTSYPNENDT